MSSIQLVDTIATLSPSADPVESSFLAFGLPPVSILRASFLARDAQRLPGLFTTAVHGALGHALRELGAYDLFLEPKPNGRSRALGVTNAAPPALTLAPVTPHAREFDRPMLISAGQRIQFDVSLIGESVIARRAVLATALARIAETGVGEKRESGVRPRLEFAELADLRAEPRRPADHVLLELKSPLRITREGRIASSVDGELLSRALLRRAALLAHTHGAEFREDEWSALSPLSIASSHLERVSVHRFSSREGRAMTWPGLRGVLELEGAGPWWPLLEFCERAQLGKATSFGFGKYNLVPWLAG